MSVEELALQLPRVAKLRLMEALWVDISQNEEEIDSPPWHDTVLRETETRFANGLEEPVDWNEAKHQLGR